jgi:hypothetical protein
VILKIKLNIITSWINRSWILYNKLVMDSQMCVIVVGVDIIIRVLLIVKEIISKITRTLIKGRRIELIMIIVICKWMTVI